MSFLHPLLGFMEGLGGSEMVFILVIVLVLFGGEKLPEFARGAGKMVREFKKAASGVEDEFKRALEEDESKKIIAPPAAVPRIEGEPPASAASATPAQPTTPAPAPPPKMMPRPDEEPPV